MTASRTRRKLSLALIFVLALATPALAAGVAPLFDLNAPSGGPFPSDRFTVLDITQNTWLRVNLPKPDCVARPSDCEDLDVINTLDGFNLQPRISIPFTGAIDPATVDSSNVFLVRLFDTTSPFDGFGKIVGINQIIWDPATNTLHAESDELLDQHTKYVLIVTDGIRDINGDRVEAGDFGRFRRLLSFGQSRDRALWAYRLELLAAVLVAGVPPQHVVAASVFTTQSATAILEKIRDQIKAVVPAPATMLATFPVGSLRILSTAIQFNQQVSTAPTFSTSVLSLGLWDLTAVSAISFGKYISPDYLAPDKFLPPVGTRTGTPLPQGTNDIYFNLILPAGTPPAGGWPVVIFGHGSTNSKQTHPILVASKLASHGLATIGINAMGRGGGPLGTLDIFMAAGGSVTIPAGGRGVDQNGNGLIGVTEGGIPKPPRGVIGATDGVRQTVADLMQLVRVIQTGGIPGLSPSRIYYAGLSFGGAYGSVFAAVEPDIRAVVLNVPGGPLIDSRLSPASRSLIGNILNRSPSILNAPTGPPFFGYNENIPLRDQPPVTNTIIGAAALQEVIDHGEWVGQQGNPVAFARYIRRSPLENMNAKPVIIQFAKGDQGVPNPLTSALIRAGDLTDRATYFRNDLAFVADPTIPKDPHGFLVSFFNLGVTTISLQAQEQMAFFLASDGAVAVDPDGEGALFEVPIVGPLPETLNFIP